MSFPSSGQLFFSQVSQFLTGNNKTQINLGSPLSRLLLGNTSGPIRFSQLYGKPIPGSISFTTPGTYSFFIPIYQTLNLTLLGAGGGGGGGDNHNIYGYGNCGYDGAGGGYSQFLSVTAYGGGGGSGDCGYGYGAAGGGTGGTVTVGGGGAGGAGGWPQQGSGNGYTGGAGGKVIASWTYGITTGYPAWATYITVIIGGGGAAAPQNASPGAPGAAYFTWS